MTDRIGTLFKSFHKHADEHKEKKEHKHEDISHMEVPVDEIFKKETKATCK